ncbi:hypothetical protein MASR2M18_18570 [Ignavibacteria bacterium]|nr:hypothetical protein [Bacteroidota bacterium]MCZ2131883.1 hypothetical protein [Bacteroidota bacterium]
MYAQKYILPALCSISIIVLAGCVSTSPRSEYFGYNNSAEAIPAIEESNRRNTLTDVSHTDGGAYTTDYRAYGYIPVIVPWWDRYYDWPGFSHTSARISYGYARYYYAPYYPWYSPWYDYNPFYGSTFYYPDHRFWRRPWYSDWQPPVPAAPQRTGTRNFGAQRGQFTPESNNDGRTNSGTIITTGDRSRGNVTEKKISAQDKIKATELNDGSAVTTDNRVRSSEPEKKDNVPDKIKVMEYRDVPVLAPAGETRRESSGTNTMRGTRSREAVAPARTAEKPQSPQHTPANSRRRNP